MVRRWIIRPAIGFGGLFALAALYSAWSYSPGAPVYISSSAATIEIGAQLRSWPEHDTLYPGGTDPYILTLEHDSGGALVYYGAKHSNDPKHPQRKDVENRWREFGPTVALCEGRASGYMTGTLFEVFTGLPEPALVHRLARRGGIRIYSLEPPYEQEVAGLIDRWPPELVAMFFVGRGYWSESGGQETKHSLRSSSPAGRMCPGFAAF